MKNIDQKYKPNEMPMKNEPNNAPYKLPMENESNNQEILLAIDCINM